MAKDNDKKEKKEGVGFAGVLIVILIITTWLSVMALMIKLDVGGFGSGALRPILKDVPVLNKILPDATDEETAKESDYPYTNLADALEQIRKLDAALGSKEAEIGALNDKVAELEKEVARLKTFEQQQEEFERVISENKAIIDEYRKVVKSLEEQNEMYDSLIASLHTNQEIAEKDVKDTVAILVGRKVF